MAFVFSIYPNSAMRPTASFIATPQMLVILADTSVWAQIQQILTQQRNELSLLKHTLNENQSTP
ncbi:hypothetical protein BGS_0911 [Beggiatoa sp. SS]|nr:hypothetical protein BGS_0911 [Beggiatoa sp. SS]